MSSQRTIPTDLKDSHPHQCDDIAEIDSLRSRIEGLEATIRVLASAVLHEHRRLGWGTMGDEHVADLRSWEEQ